MKQYGEVLFRGRLHKVEALAVREIIGRTWFVYELPKKFKDKKEKGMTLYQAIDLKTGHCGVQAGHYSASIEDAFMSAEFAANAATDVEQKEKAAMSILMMLGLHPIGKFTQEPI